MTPNGTSRYSDLQAGTLYVQVLVVALSVPPLRVDPKNYLRNADLARGDDPAFLHFLSRVLSRIYAFLLKTLFALPFNLPVLMTHFFSGAFKDQVSAIHADDTSLMTGSHLGKISWLE